MCIIHIDTLINERWLECYLIVHIVCSVPLRRCRELSSYCLTKLSTVWSCHSCHYAFIPIFKLLQFLFKGLPLLIFKCVVENGNSVTLKFRIYISALYKQGNTNKTTELIILGQIFIAQKYPIMSSDSEPICFIWKSENRSPTVT